MKKPHKSWLPDLKHWVYVIGVDHNHWYTADELAEMDHVYPVSPCQYAHEYGYEMLANYVNQFYTGPIDL